MREVVENLLKHRILLGQFAYREAFSRYKGSYFGIGWTILQPLVMLMIYGFVFSVIFRVKWGGAESVSTLDFAVVTFAGLIIFQIFSESMYRASTLLSANSNFVKKVVFPLEILPVSVVLGTLITNLFSVMILVCALIWFDYSIGSYVFLLPVIMFPLILFTVGASLIVTALGAFFRDLSHFMGIFMNIVFYLSPVFYPVKAVPEKFQVYMLMNPFTTFIESFRAILIYNRPPNWTDLVFVSVISVFLCCIGMLVFNRSKEIFSDVI
ncbi:Teichoic acid translocation permease protein TagG [compost metagenome]